LAEKRDSEKEGWLSDRLCEKHCREPLDIWPDSNSSAEGSYSDRLTHTHTHSHTPSLPFSFKQPVPSFSTHSVSASFIFFNRPLYFSLHVLYVFPHQNLSRTKSHESVEKAPGRIRNINNGRQKQRKSGKNNLKH